MATDREKKAFRDSLASGVDKYVKQQGRNTTELNCRTDAACEGYVRVPGPNACDFCLTMGAQDNFYHTRESAGGGLGHGSKDDLYHAYCNCTIALVFRRRGELVARDPDTGDAIPYDGADIVKRYREAGSPTFRKNRVAEAERRRARRRNGDVPKSKGKSTRYGTRLSDEDFDAAMKALSEAKNVDELHEVANRIVASWPKNANGRNQAQWARLSRLAKERKSQIELGFQPAKGNGKTPLVPLTKAEAMEKAKTCDRPVFCFSDDFLHDHGVKIRLGDDYYHIVAHGKPDSLTVFGVSMTPEEVCEILKARQDYHGGPVALVSCSTGDERVVNVCFARKMANILGEDVQGATMVLWTDGTPEYIIADGPFNSKRGSFKTFYGKVKQ